MPTTKPPRVIDRPAGFVIQVHGVGHFVRSRTVENGWWLVQGDHCGCPATIPDCWHYRQAKAFDDAMAPPPRPTAPPNISALVD